MKKLFLTAVAFIFAFSVSAETNPAQNQEKAASLMMVHPTAPAKAGVVAKGYRGFVDFDYTLAVGQYKEGSDRVGLLTTHGYEFPFRLFVGGGLGFNYFYDTEITLIPVYAAVRYDFLPKKISPFVDLKMGYAVASYDKATFGNSDGGVYISPSVGVRMALGRKIGLNLGIGYTYQGLENILGSTKTINLGGVTFKVGIDF